MHTLIITDSVVGSRHGTEKSIADRDFLHESGLIALYLTEVFRNAVSCRKVGLMKVNTLHAIEELLLWRGRLERLDGGMRRQFIAESDYDSL